MNSRTIPTTNGNHIISKPNSPTTGIIGSLSDIYTQNQAYAVGDNEVLQGLQGGMKKYKIKQIGGHKKTIYIQGNNLRQVASKAFVQLGGKNTIFKVDNYIFFGRKKTKYSKNNYNS